VHLLCIASKQKTVGAIKEELGSTREVKGNTFHLGFIGQVLFSFFHFTILIQQQFGIIKHIED
jgi:hypothetical protein